MDTSATSPIPLPVSTSKESHNVLSTPKQDKLSKKASLKLQKRSYKIEKKKISNELEHTIKDPSVVMLSDWLKGRTTLKNWTRIYCVLKPGVLVIYKTAKSKQWVGTVLLTSCQVIERPSKKEGFCFKIYHPLNQSIWAVKGPRGEGMGVLTNTFPSGCIILRASCDSDGHCWMDAVELAQKCSNLLKKSINAAKTQHAISGAAGNHQNNEVSNMDSPSTNADVFSPEVALDLSLLQQQLSQLRRDKISASSETHLPQDSVSENSVTMANHRRSISKTSSSDAPHVFTDPEQYSADSSTNSDDDTRDSESMSGDVLETNYTAEDSEDFGEAGEASQTEVLVGENKSLIWTLLKQVRPGMDLSKVVLPTFILEPRSFLDKLADYYYHADLLSKAAIEDNPYGRMKAIAKWYLSGFYKKPKGLKKPYNPILGETFRCKWIHPDTNSTTYYLAEQISHHPPVSNFVVINREDGFVINASILAKSKFYGNSLSAILDGEAKLLLLKRGEEYRITLPYAHCKGILYGTMTMEFGGKILITCEKTGYSTELDFKLKPFFGGTDAVNRVNGRILFGKKLLAKIDGFWDQKVTINDLTTKHEELFWEASPSIRASRLKRHVVKMEEQVEFESQRLWQHVAKAIRMGDQTMATEQKFILEEAQRKAAKERASENRKWIPKYFEQDEDGEWSYKFIDTRAWDDMNDIRQYEHNGRICTLRKLKTPKLRRSHVNIHAKADKEKDSLSNASLSEDETKSCVSFQQQPSDVSELKTTIETIKSQQNVIMEKLCSIERDMHDLQSKCSNSNYYVAIFVIITSIIAIILSFLK